MDTRVHHHGRVTHSDVRVKEREHLEEAWCLLQSVELGYWSDAGLNCEVDSTGRVLGYWKRLRCGCVLSIEVLAP